VARRVKDTSTTFLVWFAHCINGGGVDNNLLLVARGNSGDGDSCVVRHPVARGNLSGAATAGPLLDAR
jgi:hypothetical protein